MKTSHTRAVYLLLLFLVVLFTPLFLSFGAAVPPEKRGELVFGGLFSGLSCAVLAILIADILQRDIPNGKARPEDELPRRKVFGVIVRDGNFLGLLDILISRDEEELTFWRFENLSPEIKAGARIVYLDDPDQYLKKWHDEGVVMVLSAKGRARADKSPGLSPQMKSHLQHAAEIGRANS